MAVSAAPAFARSGVESHVRDRFLWIGTAIYAALFTALGAVKYGAHRNLVDFGIFQQTIASAFGCFCNPIEGSHWAFHFSPILYFPALLLPFFRSPLLLVVLQALAGALCAAPVYAIVRARTDRSTARFAAVVVWLYPPLAGLVFGDFHENGFAPVAVAWTLYAFDAGYLILAALSAALVLSVKEDQAVFLGIAAIAGAVAYRNDARGGARSRSSSRWHVPSCSSRFSPSFNRTPPRCKVGNLIDSTRGRPRIGTRCSAPASLLRVGFPRRDLCAAGFSTVPFENDVACVCSVWPKCSGFAHERRRTHFGLHYAGAWIGYVLIRLRGSRGRSGQGRAPLVMVEQPCWPQS